MIAFGASDMTKAYVGSTEGSKAYLGDELVWGGESPVLPYDAEIEWLKNAGSAYIDSGIECTGDLKVRFVAEVHNNTNAAAAGGIDMTEPFFRHHWTPVYTNSSNNAFYWIQKSMAGTSSVKFNSGSVINRWYDVTIDPLNGTAIINGTTYSYTKLLSSYTTGKSYGIFARISNTGALQRKPASFKLVQMWRNGVMLRDYIPVRVGQVGYMYDKVSGELFGNAGTGSFVLGPDVS